MCTRLLRFMGIYLFCVQFVSLDDLDIVRKDNNDIVEEVRKAIEIWNYGSAL